MVDAATKPWCLICVSFGSNLTITSNLRGTLRVISGWRRLCAPEACETVST